MNAPNRLRARTARPRGHRVRRRRCAPTCGTSVRPRAKPQPPWRPPSTAPRNGALTELAQPRCAPRETRCWPPTRATSTRARAARAGRRADRSPDADEQARSSRWPRASNRWRSCPIRSARSATSAPQPSGIRVGRMRVPLGVIGIIYESRPNVTVDAAALCLKSGNATILRGGSEAIECNRLLARLIGEALASAGLPADAVQLVDTTDRSAVGTAGDDARVRRHHRAARRQGTDRAPDAREQGADDQAPRRRLPRLHRRCSRSGDGDPDRRQRQDPALRHLQHDGDAAGRGADRRRACCHRSVTSTRRRVSS